MLKNKQVFWCQINLNSYILLTCISPLDSHPNRWNICDQACWIIVSVTQSNTKARTEEEEEHKITIAY